MVKDKTPKTIDEILIQVMQQKHDGLGCTVPQALYLAKQDLSALFDYVIGEDEPLDVQSDFDKRDIKHLETDRYPGLDGVRQASRNILREYQRNCKNQLFNQGGTK
jgi:hypothetical protein